MSDIQKVFRLRKAGKDDEALALAETLYALDPSDPWNIRAFGWVMYDRLKAAIASESEDEILLYTGKLETLPVPEEDEILKRQVTFLLMQASPVRRMLLRAVSLDFNGEHEKALAMFRDMKNHLPGIMPEYHKAYGWCLCKYLKNLISRQSGSREVWKDLLEEYFGLHPEKPSDLHSSFLMLMLRNFKDDSVFIRKWSSQFDWSLLREDDFNSFQDEHKKQIPGLAERSVQIIAKAILSSGMTDEMERFQKTLDQAMARFPANVWFYFYKAKMMVGLRKEEEARVFVVRVVREKSGEYWSWALLGDIVSGADPRLAISCYSNAMVCRADEKFLVNTRWNFGRLLHQEGFAAEARHEIELSMKTRRYEGYDLAPAMMMVCEEPWFRTAAVKKSNSIFYDEQKWKAMEFVFGAMPQVKGCLIRTFIRPDDPRKILRARILYAGNDGEQRITSVKVKNFPILKNISPGEGFLATIEPGDQERILEITRRNGSELYDQVPWMVGIVDQVNKVKKVTHVLWSRESGALLQVMTYKAGDFIRLKVLGRNEGSRGETYEVLAHELTEQEPPREIFRRFTGNVRYHFEKGHAIAGNVFMSPEIVRDCGIDGNSPCFVKGIAVASYNRVRDEWGWRAVRIDECRQKE